MVTSAEKGADRVLPRWIAVWFAIDALVALTPPLYWAFDGASAPVLGIPAAVLYFVAVSSCIAASIVAAFIAEFRGVEIG